MIEWLAAKHYWFSGTEWATIVAVLTLTFGHRLRLDVAIIAAIDKRSALTWLARFRWLRWTDRPVARLLHIEPRMLTSRIKKQKKQDQEAKPSLFQSVSKRESIRVWAWRHQDSHSAIALCLSLLILGLCLIYTLSQTIDPCLLDQHKWRHDNTELIVGTAAFSVTLFGILQAVLAFIMQLRVDPGSTKRSVVSLLCRKYLSYWLFGFMAALTMLNGAFSFLIFLVEIDDSLLASLVWVDLVLVPLSVFLSLAFLTTMLSEIGQDDDKSIVKMYTCLLASEGRSQAQRQHFIAEAESFVTAAGIPTDPYSLLGDKHKPPYQEFLFDQEGSVVDIDCVRFALIYKEIDES